MTCPPPIPTRDRHSAQPAMKPKKASGAATPNQIREVVLFDDPARVTDAQLLVLLLAWAMGPAVTEKGR